MQTALDPLREHFAAYLPHPASIGRIAQTVTQVLENVNEQ